MRNRYAVLVFSGLLLAATVPGWKHDVYGESSAAIAPYTAHLTITRERVLPDGSAWSTVSSEVIARDRQGRLYEKTEHAFRDGNEKAAWFSFFVQDPAKGQTLSWDSRGKAVLLGRWPYWAGREGCWADASGQHQVSFGDQYKVPASPREGKLVTMESIADPSGDQKVKTRVVTENLGQKVIHGLSAFGIRTTMTPLEKSGPSAMPEQTTELWKSREFDLKVLQVTSGPKYGLERMELTDLQRGDPDPALFEPPQGDTVEAIDYHRVACGQRQE